MKAVGALAVATVVAAFAGPAAADDAPAGGAGPSPRREVPDYSGRGPEPATGGDAALWVPRVILSPLYFASEYVIRRPLGVLVTEAERIELPRKVYDFFTFGPEHKAGFAPVGFYDFDFNPSVGVFLFWNDAAFKGSDLHAHFEAWPDDWLAGSITEHVRIDSARTFQLRVEGIRRPDRVFYGIGPRTLQGYQSRYARDHVEAGGWFDWRFWRASHLQTGAGFRTESTHSGTFVPDPSIEKEAATGAFPLPDGFGRDYAVAYGRLVAAIDTREIGQSAGSGVRVEMRAEQGSNVHSPASGWLKYGASAGAFLDLNQHGRVVSLSVMAMFADPLGSQPIPFTELTSLGGDGPMRGYFTGRLVDRSAAAASAHYTWPIGPWLGGTIQAAVGNVFDGHLDDLSAKLLRFSGAIGIETSAVGDYPVELIFGCGSETFEQGGQIDSFRATVSVNHGF